MVHGGLQHLGTKLQAQIIVEPKMKVAVGRAIQLIGAAHFMISSAATTNK